MSEIVDVRLPESASIAIIFEKILSVRVSEWSVVIVGCKIYGVTESDARESKNSFVGVWSL